MISVYSDGSSSSRGGKPGGWAWVMVRDETQVLYADYGGDPKTTNNCMELTAAIKGLEAVILCKAFGEIGPEEMIELVSDSQYVLGLASGGYTPSANLELAERIRYLHDELKVRTRWVRGHQGNTWNERADSLAGRGKAEIKAQIEPQSPSR